MGTRRRYLEAPGHRRSCWGLVFCLLLGCDPAAQKTTPPRGDPASVLKRANELAHRHRVAEALELIQSHTRVHREIDGNINAELALRAREASLLLTMSRPHEAKDVLEPLVALRPEHHGLRRRLAGAVLATGEAARAVELYESLPPAELSGSILEYGEALIGAERLAHGAAVVAADLIHDPWDDEAYLLLGRALVRLAREDLGERLLRRYRDGQAFRTEQQKILSFEYQGKEDQAVLLRARAERDRGRLYEAMVLDNKAMRLNPALGGAYLDLARLSLTLERPRDAVEVLRRLPSDPRVVEILRDAEASLGKVVRRDGESEELARERARIRARMDGRALSESLDPLGALVAAHRVHGNADEAKRLALFRLRLALRVGNVTESDAARQQVAELFDRADELFIRLWALSSGGEGQATLATHLTPLGLDVAKVSMWLARLRRL